MSIQPYPRADLEFTSYELTLHPGLAKIIFTGESKSFYVEGENPRVDFSVESWFFEKGNGHIFATRASLFFLLAVFYFLSRCVGLFSCFVQDNGGDGSTEKPGV